MGRKIFLSYEKIIWWIFWERGKYFGDSEIFLLTENAEILEAAELTALVRAGVGVVGGRGGRDLEAGGGRGGGGGGAGAGH